MNLAIGRKFNANFDKIFSDLKNGILNGASEEYKELLNKTAYAFPLIYVNKQSIPTLCIYGTIKLNSGSGSNSPIASG